MKRLALFSTVILAALSLEGRALALSQPDGAVIPTGAGLQNLFTSRGEAISALNDAATTPETFVPSCGLTFTVLQRNAGNKNSFGWYNVTGNKPAVQELHEFLTCNDPIGTIKTLDIKSNPAYAGGEIGFYEATGNCATLNNYQYIFFSEKKYNPDGNQANPYIHLLIYNSTVQDKAFYFGWEDLLSGGDNDFDDLTTFVTGISCSGGGGVCATGQPGVCGDGTMQCQSGKLTCVQSNVPSAEKCDGLDNDCDGLPDNGDICAANEVCDKGTCVPKCGTGEFSCDPSQVCNAAGYCVDPACADVTCPEGNKCVSGQCVGPCDGVACPHGQVCRVGACVDPCGAIKCDESQVCVEGACIDKCQCAGCAAGQACQPTGTCLPDACVGVTCNPGEYCAQDGTCADACAGATCPKGQACVMGECVADTSSGQGGNGQGGGIFVGVGGSEPTGSQGSTGVGGKGGAGPGEGGSDEGGAFGGSGGSGGCGCRIAGEESGSARDLAAAALLGALGLAAAGRRRGRRA